MKRIGKKIKEIRHQKGYSQFAVFPDSQSLISQLEKGKIKNPNEITLRTIAKNMEMPFQELIDGTDWDRNITKDKKSEYVMSIFDPIVKVESGNIDIKMRTYPRYNSDGDENRYCPNTGTALILKCPECGRSIEDPSQKYCMGCGNAYYEPKWKKFDLEPGATTDLKINRSEQKKVKELRDFKEWKALNDIIHNLGKFDPDSIIDNIREIIFGEDYNYHSISKKYKHLAKETTVKDKKYWVLPWYDELQKGKDSQIDEISSFYIQEEIREKVFDGILSELKRWEIDIYIKSQDGKGGKDENK